MVKLRPNPVDLGASLAGFGLVLYGVGRLSPEAAFILAGVLLLVGALWKRGA